MMELFFQCIWNVVFFLFLNFQLYPQMSNSGGTKKFCSLRAQDVPPTFKNVASSLPFTISPQGTSQLSHLRKRTMTLFKYICGGFSILFHHHSRWCWILLMRWMQTETC